MSSFTHKSADRLSSNPSFRLHLYLILAAAHPFTSIQEAAFRLAPLPLASRRFATISLLRLDAWECPRTNTQIPSSPFPRRHCKIGGWDEETVGDDLPLSLTTFNTSHDVRKIAYPLSGLSSGVCREHPLKSSTQCFVDVTCERLPPFPLSNLRAF